MTVFTLDNFRHETRFVIRIATRDVAKRIAAVAMILTLCWFAGSRGPVVAVALLILACEVSGSIAARFDIVLDEAPPLWLAVWMWLTNIPSTIFYMLPAALLAGEPEMPLVLSAFIWLFGVYVNISNNFVALPLYNWSQMVPAFGLGLGTVGLAAANHDGDGTRLLWAVVAGLFVVYAVHTVETMSTQKEFQRELAQARTDAGARLRALEHLSRHDPLTGLANRQAFDEGLGRMLADWRPGTGGVAMLLIDLDGFKPINDTYSHAAGDAVLRAVAGRLLAVAGEDGIAARLGGDEFALALTGLRSDRAAIDLGDLARCEIERSIAHGEKTLRVSASVGVAVARGPRDVAAGASEAVEVSMLCAGADQAMYRAKAAARAGGERRAVLYDAAAFPPRPSLEDRSLLVEALRAGAIGPEYQPIVDLATGAVTGFEALARWSHPIEGRLAPAAFLPLIREFGLQGDFLTAMAGRVLADVDGLLAQGLDPGRVSLNLPEIALATHSGRADLDRLLDAHPRARPHIVLEITEDVFIARAAEMIQDTIAHFRRRGVGISLDDFGTGFASFHHLRSLEFDELKIDASFVADLGLDPAAEVLVGGLVSMGLGLGARLIAEGVETEAQRRHLLRLGCRHGQGFLFGRAMALDDARDLLARAPTPIAVAV